MHIKYVIKGSLPVPDGTVPLPGAANQFCLPTGEVFSVHPVIEIASGADDHHDLT